MSKNRNLLPSHVFKKFQMGALKGPEVPEISELEVLALQLYFNAAQHG